ncbi:polyketide synthase [Marinobacter sediminum]|uniref:polyketide synthase n=1 Tax=Marinobacter sediminum TaxID=256323 RepID=UPI0019399763|nr:polyketide synthase [Marinobacter sediminum]
MTASCIPDSIISRFIDIAQENSDRIALKWNDNGIWNQLTYAELLEQARHTALTLQRYGISEGCSVVLPAERHPKLCAQLLGILWCGAHYVFIDPEYPPERQALIANAVSAKFGLRGLKALKVEDPGISWIDTPAPTEAVSDVSANGVLPETAAYIMFTSGSTGSPKGVVVPHRAILRLVTGTDFISISNNETFLQLSALGFDASTLEIWAPLLNGGICVLHPESSAITLEGIADVIESQGVSTLWLTSSLFNTFISEKPEALKPVKQLLTGGEALSVPHIRKALDVLPDTLLFNGYGPTENTTFSTVYPIPKVLPDNLTRIPIGYPIKGTQCALIDEHLNVLTEPNSYGELIVFGEGLALGYLNNPDLTQEKFVKIKTDEGEALTGYRTGDLATQIQEGLYDYLGRIDKQVKIDGHRIELGEIECHLNDLDYVAEARVVLKIGPQGQKRLAAYLVPNSALDIPSIRAALKSRVPSYMIPHFIIEVADLPKTQNGKLDESRLPDPYRRANSADAHPLKENTKQIVANAWVTVLNRRVGDNENFMDAGGTSLEALKLAKVLEREFEAELSATFVFEYPTIAKQTQYFNASEDVTGPGEGQRKFDQDHHEFAIIGISCRFPGADNLDEFWDNLLSGKETVSFFTDAELSTEVPPEQRSNPAYVKAKGIVQGFDQFDAAFFGISPAEARVMDPQQRILLELSWHALEDASIPPGDDVYRTGVFAGMNWARYYQQYVLPNKELVEGYGALNCGLANEPDLLSTRISYKLNLKGPSINVFTACSTGLVAVAQACEAIENGQCEQALAAGVSISTPVRRGYLYQEGSMLSKDGHCRPFDESASGTTFNDGAAAVVIKRRDLAEKDGDNIYAVIKGYAVNNDGEQKASFTAPSVAGQVAVYKAALDRADVQPSSIGFIETHGTATPLGDPIEVLSLKRCYHQGETSEKTCAIGSVKSNIGHAIHAAGLASLIKTTMAVKENKIPPTLFFKAPNPKLELNKSHFHVNTTVEGWRLPSPRRAAVTSLGVGGTNAHIILEEYTPNRPLEQPSGPIPMAGTPRCFPILISAKNKASLEQQVAQYREYLSRKTGNGLSDISYSSIFGRKHFEHRTIVFASDSQEAIKNLDSGAWSAKGKAVANEQRRLGFMFSGQGAQAKDMGLWLYSTSESYKKIFDQGCEVVLKTTGMDLKEILFTAGNEAFDEQKVNQTAFVQPALFLLEYGLAKHLLSLGVTPAFMIGHSIGEFAAAALAGIFSFEDAVKLVARRGALMQSMPPGNMLVVRASIDEITPLVGEAAELAAVNAPDMIVLSGKPEAISGLSTRLSEHKVANTLLATSHAFHSSMMEPIVSEFEQLVAETERQAPSIPIFSTMTGERLSDDEAVSPAYWSHQLRNPVRFSSAIQAASLSQQNDGNQTSFVEVGPGNTLVSLVGCHKDPKGMRAYPALKNKGTDEKAEEDIYRCVGQLWADGHSVDWGQLFGNLTPKKERLPGYAFSKDRFWLGPENIKDAKVGSTNSSALTPPEHPVTQDVSMGSNQHSEKIRAVVLEIIEDVTGYDLAEDDPAAHFSEVGLDSLLLTQVATALERKFKLGITFRNLVEDYTSLELIADYIASQVTPEASPLPAAPQSETVSQLPQPTQAPAVDTNYFRSAPDSDGSIQNIVNAQLQIMRMQLQALGGNTANSVLTEDRVSQSVNTAASASPAPTTAASNQEHMEPSAPAPAQTSHTPGTRIVRERTSTELTSAQKDWVERLMVRYQEKFAGSKKFTQKHRKHLADPRSVSGFNPAWKEVIFPIVTVESKGSKLWDIDGNELIDTSNGFGPILFGHSPDFITSAAKAQIDRGIETGPQSPLAGEVAELFCEITGNERCTFACTGSEANVGALRIARTVTGRSKVVAFEGSYHGIHDEVVMRAGKDHAALPGAPGIPKEATSNMILLPWGDPSSLEHIRKLGDELAAVLVEPVQSRKPQFHSQEYISEIRKITEENGVALILDEVVTGFRVGPGGIRKRFDIDADLQTYGKVIGGGYPIGIIAGKAKYLDAMDGGQWQYGDESIPEQGVTFFAGTFVRHPLSLAVAKAVLTKIKKDGAELYPALEKKTSEMAQEAKAFINQLKSDVSFEEFASLFYISVPQSAHWGHLLFLSMTLDGIHIQQYRPNFLTTEHSDDDVKRILTAFKSALANLVVHGLLAGDQVAAKKFLSGAIPPGAKLGKNEHGEPAYFIEDPNNKGAYMEVGRP